MLNACEPPRSVSRQVRDDTAAGYILRAARAWLARRLVQRLREEELKSRSIRSIAALNVQVGRRDPSVREATEILENSFVFCWPIVGGKRAEVEKYCTHFTFSLKNRTNVVRTIICVVLVHDFSPCSENNHTPSTPTVRCNRYY